MSWLFFVLLALISGVVFYALMSSRVGEESSSAKLILLTTAVLVPVISLVMYQQRGAFDEVAFLESMKTLNEQVVQGHGDSMQAVAEYREQLEEMTAAKPEKAEYWYLLGDVRTQMQDYQLAVNAYQQASRLFPEDISIHSRMAETQFLADNYMLTEAVRVHIDKVLSENPLDTTVLGILGISAYRAGQFEAAIRFWERSLQALPPMSPAAQSIQSSIEQAKAAAGINGSAAGINEPAAGMASQDQTDSSLAINLEVSLDDSISAEPDTSVFVFARQFAGPPMPIAVERVTVGQLPLRIRLDDSKVMIKGRKLSDFSQLELVARLSYSGQPTAQEGDYQIVLGPVNPVEVEGPIDLIISQKVTD